MPALHDAGPIGQAGRHRDAAVPGSLSSGPGRPHALPIGQARCVAGVNDRRHLGTGLGAAGRSSSTGPTPTAPCDAWGEPRRRGRNVGPVRIPRRPLTRDSHHLVRASLVRRHQRCEKADWECLSPGAGHLGLQGLPAPVGTGLDATAIAVVTVQGGHRVPRMDLSARCATGRGNALPVARCSCAPEASGRHLRTRQRPDMRPPASADSGLHPPSRPADDPEPQCNRDEVVDDETEDERPVHRQLGRVVRPC